MYPPSVGRCVPLTPNMTTAPVISVNAITPHRSMQDPLAGSRRRLLNNPPVATENGTKHIRSLMPWRKYLSTGRIAPALPGSIFPDPRTYWVGSLSILPSLVLHATLPESLKLLALAKRVEEIKALLSRLRPERKQLYAQSQFDRISASVLLHRSQPLVARKSSPRHARQCLLIEHNRPCATR
jgi:hypothetical protein